MNFLENYTMCSQKTCCDGCFFRQTCFWRKIFYFECYQTFKVEAHKRALEDKKNKSTLSVENFYNSLDRKRELELKNYPVFSEK